MKRKYEYKGSGTLPKLLENIKLKKDFIEIRHGDFILKFNISDDVEVVQAVEESVSHELKDIKDVPYDPDLCVDFAGEIYNDTDTLMKHAHLIDEAFGVCLEKLAGMFVENSSTLSPLLLASTIRRMRAYIEEQAKEAVKILQDNEGKK